MSPALQPDMFDTIVAMCKKAKFHPRIAASPNLWQSVRTMVEAGEGVTLVLAGEVALIG